MTKRHHATNYHRCKQCGQPLVRERQLCLKCELAQLNIPAAQAGQTVCEHGHPGFTCTTCYPLEPGEQPEFGAADAQSLDIQTSADLCANEPEVFRP